MKIPIFCVNASDKCEHKYSSLPTSFGFDHLNKHSFEKEKNFKKFNYVAINTEALPLYGHPHIRAVADKIKRNSENSLLYSKKIIEHCEKNFEYVNDSEEAIMVYPMGLRSPAEIYIERRDFLANNKKLPSNYKDSPNALDHVQDFKTVFYETFKHRKIYSFTYTIGGIWRINEVDKDIIRTSEYHWDDNTFKQDTFDHGLNIENIFSYQTHLYKSKRNINEYPLPAIFEDVFDNNYITQEKFNIGFCGAKHFDRDKILNKLKKTKYKTNFITTINGNTGTKDFSLRNRFYKNIQDNLFTFCMRGGANFCWRFYETLMMGRVPILVESDRCFLFEDHGVNINDVCVLISQKDKLKDIESKIDNFISNNNMLEIQKHNRWVWETYCSPIGIINDFISRVKENN